MFTYAANTGRGADNTPQRSSSPSQSSLPNRAAYPPEPQTANQDTTHVAEAAILQRGAKGAEVFKLQERINTYRRDCGLERLKVDGDFGPKTERAVIELKASLSKELKITPPLKADGVWNVDAEQSLKAWESQRRSQQQESVQSSPNRASVFKQTGYENGRPYSFEAREVVDVSGKLFILSAATADAFESMRESAAGDGVTLKVVSAFRTNQDQERLRKLWESGQGNPANRPGYSNHQSGFAVDIKVRGEGSENVLPWLEANAERFGFDSPYRGQLRVSPTSGKEVRASNEPWHWEYVPDRERLQPKAPLR